jgi:hypothetical protein
LWRTAGNSETTVQQILLVIWLLQEGIDNPILVFSLEMAENVVRLLALAVRASRICRTWYLLHPGIFTTIKTVVKVRGKYRPSGKVDAINQLVVWSAALVPTYDPKQTIIR